MNYREDIKALIDGELSPEKAEQVRAAIAADPALKADYEFMKSVTSQIQSSAKMPEVQGFDSAMQAIRPVRKFNWRAGLAIGGVAVLLLVFAAPALMKNQSADSMALNNELSSASADADSTFRREAFDAAPQTEEMSTEDDREPKPADLEFSSSPPNSGRATKRADGASARESDPEIANARTFSGADSVRGGNNPPGVGGFGGGGGGATAEMLSSPQEGGSGLQVIKNANFELQVDDLNSAVASTRKLVKSINGTFGSRAAEQGETDAIWLTLQVPQGQFDHVVTQLRKLGIVRFEKAGKNDVTMWVNRDASRIDQLKKDQGTVEADLTNAKTETDVKNTRLRLKRIEEEIDTLKLKNSVQMSIAKTSEINVYLVQKGK